LRLNGIRPMSDAPTGESLDSLLQEFLNI